jgi:hypothetical protein
MHAVAVPEGGSEAAYSGLAGLICFFASALNRKPKLQERLLSRPVSLSLFTRLGKAHAGALGWIFHPPPPTVHEKTWPRR